MKTITLIALSILVSISANAINDPNFERPIMGAKMEILDTNPGFQDVRLVRLTLTHRSNSENFTGLVLELGSVDSSGREIMHIANHKLKIYDIELDGCGTWIYKASLAPRAADENTPTYQQPRVLVELKDHSKRTCENLVPYIWEAKISQGIGPCGTNDARMDVGGNPEYLASIE